MSHEYHVIARGHTHAGKELAVGAVVPLRESVAKQFPTVFERVEPPKAARPARTSPTAAPAHED